jgi:hypothetical protein
MNEPYVCKKCGYYMALAPLKHVSVIHLPNGKHTYRILKGRS